MLSSCGTDQQKVHEFLCHATIAKKKKKLLIRNKTYKASIATTTPLWTPSMESQNSQVKPLLELTALVKKIESLIYLLVLYTTGLSS